MHTSTGEWFLPAEHREEWPGDDLSTETIIDAITDVVYMVDRRGRFVEWNEQFREATGYTDAAIADLHQFDIIPDESETEALELLAKVADGAEVTLEAPLVTADGEEIPYEFTASPLTDDDGTVWGMAGTARDISTHQAREDLLRDLHDAMRELLAAETEREIADAAVRIAYERLDCGTAAVRLLEDDQLVMVAVESEDDQLDGPLPPVSVGEGFVGEAYERGEAVVHDDFREADAPHREPARSALLVPIPGHGTITLASREPAAFDEVDVELARVFAADVEAALERADRERRLRERKRDLEGYETLVETIRDGVYMTDSDRRVTMVNDAMAEMLGYDREELVGSQTSIATNEEVLAEVGQLKEQLLDGNESVATLNAEIERADGTLLPIENRISMLPGEGDQGTVGVIRDVTNRRRREEQLKTSRDELARLNRINELVQETIQALVSAATREEIEATVCERLTDSDLYRLALTGDLRRADGVVECNEWAGEGSGYIDAFSMASDDDDTWDGPGGRAVQTGEVQVCQDVATDPQLEPWREAALANDLRSVTAVPLRHGETVHGILFVYADRKAAFSSRELRAFEVLGDMVGFAISATQNRRLIQADDLLEFEFSLSEAGTATAGLTESLDCRYRLLGIASTADPGLLHYIVVEGATPEEVRSALADAPDGDRVENVRVVSTEGDSCLLEARIVDSVSAVLQESGVQIVGAVAEDGTIEFVARGSRDLDVRALLERLASTHGQADLVAKREVAADERADGAAPASATERLTDRQAAALNAAYFSGYFDWPRDSTAEAVADALGIASATLHQHLRHALRKLIESSVIDGADRGT